MHDIRDFTLKDMADCSGALRGMGAGAASMEETAGKIVHYLYEQLIDGATGEKALALARLFKSHPYSELSDDQRRFAESMLDGQTASPDMKCLTLLASEGARPEWCARERSAGHQAIPLPSEHFVEKFPMIRNLVQQLGLEISTVLRPDPTLLMDLEQTTYNVFLVPEAVGSPFLPAQQEFILPHGVRSVLGFGGMLPSGNLFVVILFARAPFSSETAEMFRTLALSAKLALLPFDGGAIFV